MYQLSLQMCGKVQVSYESNLRHFACISSFSLHGHVLWPTIARNHTSQSQRLLIINTRCMCFIEKQLRCASGCVSPSLQYIWRWLKVFLSGQMFVVIL